MRLARGEGLRNAGRPEAVNAHEAYIVAQEAGMVLAIGNCGIYREEFGVRAEDTIWVSAQGPVPLTRHPKNLAV